MQKLIRRRPHVVSEISRISTSRFLTKCHKRRQNQGSLSITFAHTELGFLSCAFSGVVKFCLYRCVIGCQDHLNCVEWEVKLYC